MKENRTLAHEDLRQMCIKNNLCTRMYNDEYTDLLNLVTPTRSHVTSKFIGKLARKIHEGSDTEMDVGNVAFLIAKTCNSYFTGYEGE